jgi:two-component system KDP operon response regulator KdpE
VRTWTNNPIIIVSARDEVRDKIAALDAGADDYLTKPCSVDELMARIRVAQRKINLDASASRAESAFSNGDLFIDYAANLVTVAGVEVHLTRMEYNLLCLLAQNADKILTHNFILGKIWPHSIDSDTQSLRVFMASLRKKIEKTPSEPKYLQTHIGIGYRLTRIRQDDAPEE